MISRKRLAPLSVLTLSLLLVLSSCASQLKPLDARQVSVDPQPLVLQGGKVPVSITINFPQKWMHKRAEIKITPVLKYATGQAWGSTYSFQGEEVRGNATTIRYNQGGSAILHSDFDYTPEMQKSELYLMFSVKIGNKSQELADVKIGEGVVATEALASADYVTPAIAPDVFQRVLREQYDANIHFLIQQASLRQSETNSEEVEEWRGIVESAHITPNQKVDVEVQAYASPDGGRDLNEKLAAERERNTTRYLERELSRAKVDAPVAAHYTAQDWEGFKQLVEKSDIQDKELVLRVLSMYNDPEIREREIKNISTVFSQLADEILPQLRRSRLVANIQIIGKSDEEIAQLSASQPQTLTVEELLYSATLTDDPKAQERIYLNTTSYYPRDARAFNNLGVLALQNKDLRKAEGYFIKADEVARAAGKSLQETKLNQGIIELHRGNVERAQELIGQAGNVPELDETLGLMLMKQGKYVEAAKYLYNTATNNGVLAQILNKDYARAEELLEQITNPDAQTHYLRAIIAARTGDSSTVRSALTSATQLDPALQEHLAKDREFVKYLSNGQLR
ncbi:MAG: hypothetical protein Q4D93_04105 [Porphyromonas sp.]|nr:hypothetical protein [Porphyromonas sp.]